MLSANKFQLTRSRGARPPCLKFVITKRSFQLTRSRGARQRFSIRLRRDSEFQLTRSRGARRGEAPHRGGRAQISTHALTWSATYRLILDDTRIQFQLTRSRGARHAGHVFLVGKLISTHALTWSATGMKYLSLSLITISTHALTWSATCSDGSTIY